MTNDVAEPRNVNKSGKSYPRPLADLLHRTLSDAFAKQGFASTELVTRWTEIVGAEIAAHSEPEKIQWPRPFERQMPEPGVLVLRVEGPMAIEIQHLSNVVLERVNRFFGWRAVGGLRLRQAPLRRKEKVHQTAPDPEATARIAADLSEIADDDLRDALARLGAAIKQS
jgi:hypothetical protein